MLPGNDGKPAPVFAGGSNIGISAKSKNQEGSRELLTIIFSSEYQRMRGQNGRGPANALGARCVGATTVLDRRSRDCSFNGSVQLGDTFTFLKHRYHCQQ